MNETLTLALSGLAGLLIGAVFFGGLWLPVRKGISSSNHAWLFVVSFVLRTAIALAGFYYVSGDQWRRLLLCLLGFIIARVIITWLTRPFRGSPVRPPPEAGHAP